MLREWNTNQNGFFTFVTDPMPSAKPLMIFFIFIKIGASFIFLLKKKNKTNNTTMATKPRTRNTVRLLEEGRLILDRTQSFTVENSNTNASAITPIRQSRSIILSVTTVPMTLTNDKPSYLANEAARITSPERGNPRLARYPTRIVPMVLIKCGLCPRGSINIFHLIARLMLLTIKRSTTMHKMPIFTLEKSDKILSMRLHSSAGILSNAHCKLNFSC